MTKNTKKVLGKGLRALIPEKKINTKSLPVKNDDKDIHSNIIEIDIEKIVPDKNQPRVIFEQEKMDELCHSIKNHGVIQPILVRALNDGSYKIIFGERRFRASKMLGKKTIPAMIKEADDQKSHMIALIENIQRENLNAIEEGEAYQKLLTDGHYTQEQLAEKVGKSRSAIANSMRLLKLPSKIQNFLIEKKLSMGHIRCLLSIESDEDQYKLALKAVENDLSVREFEKEISLFLEEKNNKREKIKSNNKNKELDPNLIHFIEKMQHKFSCKVVLNGNYDKGQINFEYHTKDDLHRILELFGVIE